MSFVGQSESGCSSVCQLNHSSAGMFHRSSLRAAAQKMSDRGDISTFLTYFHPSQHISPSTLQGCRRQYKNLSGLLSGHLTDMFLPSEESLPLYVFYPFIKV